MGGKGMKIGGLTLVLIGVLGVCLACGLPMWRETSFVGANIVTAQSVWDGLWLHCIFQATGQMQCKRHTTSITMTSDIQAGRALTLISIIAGLLGFIVTLLGGGVVNCSGAPPDSSEPPTNSSSSKKVLKLYSYHVDWVLWGFARKHYNIYIVAMSLFQFLRTLLSPKKNTNGGPLVKNELWAMDPVCLVGGALCILAGILCLISVSWSAAATISLYNDPLVAAALKREVGSSIYIGWVSSALLLLGGALICCVCGEKQINPPPRYTYMPYSINTQYSGPASHMATLRSDVIGPNSSRMSDHRTPSRMIEHKAQVHEHNQAQSGRYYQPLRTPPRSEQGTFGRNPSYRSGTPDKAKGLVMGMNPNLVRDIPSRATTVRSEYYFNSV